MKKIIPLSTQEKEIVLRMKTILSERKKAQELESLMNNESALFDLARSISQYPSILGTQHLGTTSRSVDTLVENLRIHDSADLVLYIPTKALLGKGFSIAKINFFYMILYLVRDLGDMDEMKTFIFDIISNNIFTVMAEEVFLSIIADHNISQHIRNNAGYLLANIWEYRMDHGVREFSPVLNNIWHAREKLKPAYGTMLGISELFKISENSSGVWIDFLQRDDLSGEEIDSMQEFLLGLTYEEMNHLNEIMTKTGKSCINFQDITLVLGKEKIYPEYSYEDPRELFKSYRHRHKNAGFRLRAVKEGPKKTLEEYIMCYLLSRPEEVLETSPAMKKY